MDSRYTPYKSDSFCFRPVTLYRNGRSLSVPCGRCDGCLLHIANSWQRRVSDAIEFNCAPLFFTLTYSNKYVPKYRPVRFNDTLWKYIPLPTVRFDGSKDVPRKDEPFLSQYFQRSPIASWNDGDVIAVHSKRDIQLWLKLLRKDLYENYNISRNAFRYYVISEYGVGSVAYKGRYRPHYHGIIFPVSKEVGEILRTSVLFKNWQMCDKSLFDNYVKYCDSGTGSYIASYVSGRSDVPKFYNEKEVRPFRLASQKPCFGFESFDKSEVQEKILDGIDEYNKSVPRVGRNYIFQYSKKVTDVLFPKCTGYDLLDYDGLLSVYGCLYQRKGLPFFDDFCRRFRKVNATDYYASRRCLEFCERYATKPSVYLFFLVQFHYRRGMRALRLFYEGMIAESDSIKCIAKYDNIIYLLDDRIDYFDKFGIMRLDYVEEFLSSFGFSRLSVSDLKILKVKIEYERNNNREYQDSVSDILFNLDKTRKANALAGLSPV